MLPEKAHDESSFFATQILGLIITLSLLLVLTAVGIDQISDGVGNAQWFFGFSAIASLAYAVKEFYVRVAFSRDMPAIALAMHLGLGGALATAAFGIRDGWSAETAILVYASAQTAAAALGQLLTRLPLTALSSKEMKLALFEVLPGGKWAALSSIVYSLRANAHTLIVGALLGPAAVAAVNAARLLVTPATLLIPALSNLALPQFARHARKFGAAGVKALSIRVGMALVVTSMLYGLVLLIVWTALAGRILGPTYADNGTLVFLWWIFACLLTMRCGLEWGNQALRRFSGITWTNAAATALALLSVVLLTIYTGPAGAILGTIIGELAIISGLAWLLWRKKK